MWTSLEQRWVGLLSEMEGMASQIYEIKFREVQIWNKFGGGPNHLFFFIKIGEVGEQVAEMRS